MAPPYLSPTRIFPKALQAGTSASLVYNPIKGDSTGGEVVPISRLVVCILILVPAGWAASQERSAPNGRQVDLSLKGDLTGDGRVYRVEWYHRGPIESGNPPSYVVGVSVRALPESSPVLAQWEAKQPTDAITPDPKLDELWPVFESGGRIITVKVSYGVKGTELAALRFDGRRLRVVGHWQETGFTVTRLGPAKQLIVIQTAGSAGNFPTIYAWTGTEFKDVSREYPNYYVNWGAPFLKEIRNSEPVLAAAVASDCQFVLKAFDYAGQLQVARQACLDAKKRISTGWAIIPDQEGESVQDFEQEKGTALDAINRALADRKGPRPEAARLSDSPKNQH